jgi:hypothetical protein
LPAIDRHGLTSPDRISCLVSFNATEKRYARIAIACAR